MPFVNWDHILHPSHDSALAAVWIKDNIDTIADQDLYPVHSHLARKISENFAIIRKLNLKKSVRKGLKDLSDYLVFWVFFARHREGR